MNERERAELEILKLRQAALLSESVELGRKLAALEARLFVAETVVPPVEPAPATQPPIPVVEIVLPQVEITEIEPPKLEPTPVEIPPVLEPQLEAAQAAEPAVPPVIPKRAPAQAFAQSRPPLPPKPPAPPVAEKGSFEMRLGTFWLVRIGIVMLLTGLVFFGNYAYHNYIGKLPPAGKVSLLYLASGALLGIGTWLQRKKELKNYAQVLIAGGLAAVYFTTYAAHHFSNLLVIKNATLDGALLLAWAGFVIWFADRKKSEVLALFAVLLSYYTSIITDVGLFTLYSNLVLTVTAVFFLVRNRWATLSFASLAATYISYGFWRFYHQGIWGWATPDSESFHAGLYFLIAYWIVFTGAVFLSRSEQFFGQRRAAFLSFNNAAFFSAFIFTMWQVHQGGFWKFALIYGSALTALWLAARKLLSTDRLCQNAYLTQGLLLITLGFVTHITGLKLSLVLTVESVMLVILGQQMKSRVMQVASMLAGALAVGYALSNLKSFDNLELLKGVVVGGAMLFNAFWLGRDKTNELLPRSVLTVFYSVLALGMWLFSTCTNVHAEWLGPVLAAESLAFLIACRPLGNHALKYGGGVYAVIATGWELVNLTDEYHMHASGDRVGIWAALLFGAAMILNALWMRREATPENREKQFYPPTTFFSSLGMVTWLAATFVFAPREYLAPLLAVEALVFTASIYALRLNEVALFGQFFLFIAQGFWISDTFLHPVTHRWWNPVSVIVITLALAQWWQQQKRLALDLNLRRFLLGAYALAVVGLLYFWLQPLYAGPTWLAFASGLAILLTVYAALNRFWLLVAAGQIFVIVSTVEFVRQLWDGEPMWYLPLVPIATFCLLSFCAVKWFQSRPDAAPAVRNSVLQLSQVYRVVALAMSLWWVHKYIPAQQLCWVLVAIGSALFALAGWRRSQELLIFSAVFTLAGILRFWIPYNDATRVYLPNLLAILAMLAQQRFARRLPEKFQTASEAHAITIGLGGLSLWFFVSRWIMEKPAGSFVTLTAGWAVLALVLFIIGMALRERIYRWLGLTVLAGALGRVVFIEVWRLETIYKILSFMALGIVLLVLGFIYNKYQEKIKEWL